MGAVHGRWGFEVAPAIALAAGADVALVNQGDRAPELLEGILVALLTGGRSEARLDDAVQRILALRGTDATGITCPRACSPRGAETNRPSDPRVPPAHAAVAGARRASTE